MPDRGFADRPKTPQSHDFSESSYERENDMDEIKTLSREFSLKPEHVENIISLLDGGSTVPFIARYRKERTGSVDDQVLRALSERLDYLRNLAKRREEILASIREQGKLTPELESALDKAATLAAAEDLYRPFRPKRRTRATVAAERGLVPLAERILTEKNITLSEAAKGFIDPEKGVDSVDDALAGAHDVIA